MRITWQSIRVAFCPFHDCKDDDSFVYHSWRCHIVIKCIVSIIGYIIHYEYFTNCHYCYQMRHYLLLSILLSIVIITMSRVLLVYWCHYPPVVKHGWLENPPWKWHDVPSQKPPSIMGISQPCDWWHPRVWFHKPQVIQHSDIAKNITFSWKDLW